MPITMDRRLFLQTGMLGLGAASAPLVARGFSQTGFTHDVASGEPSQNSVMLWTRYISEGEPVLRAEVAEDMDFGRIVTRGETLARTAHDFTAKVTVSGLEPDRWYYYRFRSPDGELSATGRTRTLPEGSVRSFSLGLFSCSNLRFGWFNAYAHAAQRNDLDLIIHSGDYLYEYNVGRYPGEGDALAGRMMLPEGETIALADYWLRWASYRADPDLRALHRNFPMIARWDDHEITNDPWMGGAENHQADEGEWDIRKAAALQAYRDWMPVSDDPWDSYQIGDLATIFLPETRITGRVEQLDFMSADLDGGIEPGLAIFRDGPWSAEGRTILGMEQEAWLSRAMAQSTASGTRWQVLVQQVLMGRSHFPLPLADALMNGAPDGIARQLALRAAATRVGLPINLDAWDGYPAARGRLLRSALDADANLIVLSGDSHNSWAFDLHQDNSPAGVEFGGQSVTSPGYEGFLPQVPPDRLAPALVAASPDMRWADTSGRGYVTVTLTPEAVHGEWLYCDTVRQRSTTIARRHSMTAQHGACQFDA